MFGFDICDFTFKAHAEHTLKIIKSMLSMLIMRLKY
jgi:hypothetical protein